MLTARRALARWWSRGWRAHREPGDESGFVLAFVAISLVVLLAMAGFAVDFWHWSREEARLQSAADAAALAGAVFMPNNTGQVAYTTAQSIAGRNGYTNGQNGVTVTPTVGQLPTQLQVTISEKVQNYFGSLVGAGTTTITKHAVAEYEPSVSMGSPINQFGNDPELGVTLGTPRYPELWANVFGPASYKDKGDAYQSALLHARRAGRQLQRDQQQHRLRPERLLLRRVGRPGRDRSADLPGVRPRVRERRRQLRRQQHGERGAGHQPDRASQLPPNFNPDFAVSNPSTRYSSSANSVYCSGDQYYSDGNNGLTPPWTDYIIRAPAAHDRGPAEQPDRLLGRLPRLPRRPEDRPPGDHAAGGRARPVREVLPAVVHGLHRPEPGPGDVLHPGEDEHEGQRQRGAQRWRRQPVRDARRLNGNYQTSNAQIAGWGRQGIYANYPGANTTFDLARVPEGAPGRTLIVNFFDVGDASQPGTLTVLPPSDSNVGASFSGCSYTAPPGNSTGPPWGTFSSTSSSCSISGVQTPLFNGQWITYQVPIPSNYTCNYTDPSGCWARVNFQFPNLTSVQDTTTWTAQIAGDPVRLVE